MNTNNITKEKISRGCRAIAFLALAILATSITVTGCSTKPNSSDGRTSGGGGIKCGTATCNRLTQKCENGQCVPKAGTTIPCGTSTCNAATQECVEGKCVNKCGETVCSDAQNCVEGECVAKDGRTECGSTTCDDNTQECKNNTCVERTIECGTTRCLAATQECRNDKCVMKSADGDSTAECDSTFQEARNGTCIIKNSGDGSCTDTPCTGDNVCQDGECVSVCKLCDESANYVGCFSKGMKCTLDSDSGNYMATNESTGEKTACANPVCGRLAPPVGSPPQTPCYDPLGGDCSLEDGEICVQIGNSYNCAKAPQEASPCGEPCPENQQCNTANNQCEPIPESSVPAVCDNSAVVPPPDVTDLTFVQDENPGKSYRSVATINTTIGRHSASIGAFETAMNSCGAAQTSDTGYQVFRIHLDTYANIEIYSNTTSDESFEGFAIALLSASSCSRDTVKGCERDFRIAKNESEDWVEMASNTLPEGDYYLVVKNENTSNITAPETPWTIKVVKETYDTKGECREPEQPGTTYACDTNKKAYTEECQTRITAPPLFGPRKITCLTTEDSQATKQGCYRESSNIVPDCYGVTCDKPIVVDGSTKRTITFTDMLITGALQSVSANYTDPAPLFTNSSCTPTTAPTGIMFTYVLEVTNLQPDSKVVIRFPPTGLTSSNSTNPLLRSSSAVARFQTSCGVGETCLSAQSFNNVKTTASIPNTAEFSYPQNSSDAIPGTLYITLGINTFTGFPIEMNAGFDLIITTK